MQASEGLAVRAYESGDMYRGAHDLRDGELPRTPDPYVPPGSPCPRCDHSGHISWRLDPSSRCIIVDCVFCGYHKEEYAGAAMPLTEEMKGQIVKGAALLDRVCTCGKEFKTKAGKPHDLCQRCRSRKQTTEWAKEHPERYAETQKKHRQLIRERKQRAKKAAEFL